MSKIPTSNPELNQIPDVSSLIPGEILSYSKLCKRIKVRPVEGRPRQLRLTSLGTTGFQRFFKLAKVSHGKYQILEIYDEPLPPEDKRKPGCIMFTHGS